MITHSNEFNEFFAKMCKRSSHPIKKEKYGFIIKPLPLHDPSQNLKLMV